jgi:hypothetical protein
MNGRTPKGDRTANATTAAGRSFGDSVIWWPKNGRENLYGRVKHHKRGG